MTSDPLVIGFLFGIGLCAAVAVFVGLVGVAYLVGQRLADRRHRWREERFSREVDRLEERLAVDEAQRLVGAGR